MKGVNHLINSLIKFNIEIKDDHDIALIMHILFLLPHAYIWFLKCADFTCVFFIFENLTKLTLKLRNVDDFHKKNIGRYLKFSNFVSKTENCKKSSRSIWVKKMQNHNFRIKGVKPT